MAVRVQTMVMRALQQVSAFNHIPQFGHIPGQAWNCTENSSFGPVESPAVMDALAMSVALAAGTSGVLYPTTYLSGWSHSTKPLGSRLKDILSTTASCRAYFEKIGSVPPKNRTKMQGNLLSQQDNQFTCYEYLLKHSYSVIAYH